jgi:hypothetical protein
MWSFRKSIRLPLGTRLNLSKSGLGVSMGIPGLRVGLRSPNRQPTLYQSLPGTGLYNRQKLNSGLSGFSILAALVDIGLLIFRKVLRGK